MMRGNWPAAAILIFATFLTCVPTSAQSFGTAGVRGTVLNEEGQIVDYARVCVSITEKNSTTINCRFLVGRDGHFQIEELPRSTYSVFAINEGEGYSIENQSPGIKVEITNENPWAAVAKSPFHSSESSMKPSSQAFICRFAHSTPGYPWRRGTGACPCPSPVLARGSRPPLRALPSSL